MRLFVHFVLLTLIIGCSHVPTKPPAPFKPSLVIADQKKRKASFNKFAANLDVGFWDRSGGGGGIGQLVAVPRAMRLELRDPLGRLQYLATLLKKDFMAYYPKRAVSYQDKLAGRAYFRKILGINMSFVELRMLMVGVLPVPLKKANKKDWQWDGRAGVYQTKVFGSGASFLVSVEPARGILKSIAVNSKRGNYTIEYDKYHWCCGFLKRNQKRWLAHEVVIRTEDKKTSLKFGWKELMKIPKTPKDGVFKHALPKPVRKIFLKG